MFHSDKPMTDQTFSDRLGNTCTTIGKFFFRVKMPASPTS